MEKDLSSIGLPTDASDLVERSRNRRENQSKRREASASVARSKSYHEAVVARTERPRARSGVRDKAMESELVKRAKRDAARLIGAKSKKGEGDHHIPDLKPKHLFSGKRSIGTNQRR